MDRQRTQQGTIGPNTKTAQAPAEPIRPPEVNRVHAPRPEADEEVRPDEDRSPSRPHPGSPQTPK